MKNFKVIFLMSILCIAYSSTMQGQVKINVNVDLQPQWGPALYDYAEYYFLPELGIYYSVPDHVFIYPEGHGWKFSRILPPRYHADLYSTYKVVLNEPKPYLRHDYYATHYRDYSNIHQENRRDFKGNNGKHKGWEKNGKMHDDNMNYDRGDDYNEHSWHKGHSHDRD
jgi:hypothetical protein